MTTALLLPDWSRPPPEPEPPSPDPALIAEAHAAGEAAGYARGFADGMAEGLRGQAAAQEAEIARAMASIAAALQEAADAGRRAAEEAAEALASLLLAAMEAALPGAAARAGEDLLPRVLAPLLPAIADRPEARLRVAPALVAGVAARLPADALAVEADESVAPGDARLVWRDGALVVSLERRRLAVRAALLSAGFTSGESEVG